MIKSVYFLANSGAGQQAEDLNSFCDLLDDAGISVDLHQVKSRDDLKKHANALTPKSYDAILVYGGDGSVFKIAQQLSNDKVPLCILPGGTNNALARSLGQNLSASQALKALIDGRYDITNLDVALCNNKPFVFDLHYGVLADAITETSRKTKQKWGSAAYVATGLKQLKDLQAQDFSLKLDNQKLEAKAVLCYITNSGLPRFLGTSFFKRKRADDGLLDLALVKTAKFWPLVFWLFCHTWLGQGSSRTVALYRSQKITILKAPNEVFYDDVSTVIKPPFDITVKSRSFPVIVPRKMPLGQRLQSLALLTNIQIHRGTDHLRRIFFGMSAIKYSQLNENIFIGGQPGKKGFKTLQAWGVNSVISMRTRKPDLAPKELKILHLPTTDHAAVDLKDLQKGVDFINKQIEKGGKVYIHCRMGEGRAASMAIAYLVSQGMFLNDALTFIKQHRTFISPNQKQLARLREFARQLRKHEQ